MDTFPEFAEHNFSGATEDELVALRERLECKLADQHPRHITQLFDRICDIVRQAQGCLEPSHVASVIDWSEADLRDYLHEVLQEQS